MAKRTLNERLNDALEEILASPEGRAFPVDPELSPLLQIAINLRDMPDENFRAKLKIQIQRRAIMSKNATAIAEVTVPITPYLCCRNAAQAIDFYKQVFGATETMRLVEPNGKIGHAEIQIGASSIMIADEYPDYGALSPESIGGTPVTIHIYVDDVDDVLQKAIDAGAKLKRPATDEFYGNRDGQIIDPAGHRWFIATKKEDLTSEEIERRYQELMKVQPPANEEAPVAAQPVSEELHTFAPYLHVQGADRMMQFLKHAFLADVVSSSIAADGTIAHAQIRIGEAVIEMGEAHGQFGPMPSAFHLYVNNADVVYQRALQAGATSLYEPSEMPYGDREAGVVDPFGNHWYLGSRAAVPGKLPIPPGYSTVTPYLAVKHGAELVEFTKRAFGAVETHRTGDQKTAFHAEVRIGSSMVMIGGFPGMPYPETTAALYLYVPDVDAMYEEAIQAGGIPEQPPTDRAYGDRVAHVRDPFGNIWYLASRKG